MNEKIIIAGYGLFLLLGGFFGWRAGSSVSLMMGVASSAVVFLGLYWRTVNPKAGLALLMAVGGMLAVVFLMRLFKTHKIMPAGMLLAVSLAFFVYCLSQWGKN